MEDDRKTARLIELYFAREGYAVEVVGDGQAGLDAARRQPADLALIDLMLPRVDGLDVCRILRNESDLGIIVITARTAAQDALIAFEVGADDYVRKPVLISELLARANAVLRRRGEAAEAKPDRLTCGAIVLERHSHQAFVGDEPLALTPKEWQLLVKLVEGRGRTFTRRQLLDAAFGLDYDGGDRTVDTHLWSLRRKLDRDSRTRGQVGTVYGVGYRLTSPDAGP
jgi:DNA-binding response OmpR family regulator